MIARGMTSSSRPKANTRAGAPRAPRATSTCGRFRIWRWLARTSPSAEFLPDDDRPAWLRDLDELRHIADSSIQLVYEGVEGKSAEAIRLDELAEAVVKEFAATGLPVRLAGSSSMLVRGAPLAMTRVLRNLVTNASPEEEARLLDAIAALENLPVQLPRLNENAAAASVPLRSLATFEQTEGFNQISRENGKRRVVATAEIRGRDIGSLVAEAQAVVDQRVKLAPGIWLSWGGQFENFSVARQRLTFVVPGCFLLIFLLLFSALGSARDALLVFSAVPLALTGGIAARWVRGMPFSISAAVGFIALSGVAVLNGLVMLSQIRKLIGDGVNSHAAISQGALTRFRPVIMTALVASLGFVPMALATGTGAEVQKPLATVVIGGLLSATLLTLLVLPALYSYFASREEQAKPDRAFIPNRAAE
jgi:AcrB/AcrD/AcrF family